MDGWMIMFSLKDHPFKRTDVLIRRRITSRQLFSMVLSESACPCSSPYTLQSDSKRGDVHVFVYIFVGAGEVVGTMNEVNEQPLCKSSKIQMTVARLRLRYRWGEETLNCGPSLA